ICLYDAPRISHTEYAKRLADTKHNARLIKYHVHDQDATTTTKSTSQLTEYYRNLIQMMYNNTPIIKSTKLKEMINAFDAQIDVINTFENDGYHNTDIKCVVGARMLQIVYNTMQHMNPTDMSPGLVARIQYLLEIFEILK